MTSSRQLQVRRRAIAGLRLCAATAALVAAVTLTAGVACRKATSASAVAPDTSPVRIVLGWAGDPATSQAVTWRTTAAVASPQAQIGLAAPDCGGAIGPVRNIAAVARTIDVGRNQRATHYKAGFTGLAPATRYAYRVGSASSSSRWHCFSTASAEAAPFRFIYLGDAQRGLGKRWPEVVRAAFAAAPGARFVVHAGDLLDEGYDDGQWRAWLAGLGDRAAELPGVPVPGNHDVMRSRLSRVAAAPDIWNAHFALPANGPADLPELAGQSYYLDYQGVRIVALDVNAFANEDFRESQRSKVQAAQLTWLRNVLGENPQRWTIVVQHYPMYPVAKHRDFGRMRAALGALYDKFGVNLVLQGHDHAYGRTHKVYDGRLADPEAPGTVYATSVSGSKMYAITTRWRPLMARLQQDAQLYQVVSVTGDTLSYESRAVDGTAIDAFELVKRSSSASRYVNQAPRPAGVAPQGREN
ncbi:MAG: metallophosphoesterase family protein [Vicinamibacterales bacterium]|nr:metallophosphoesterase family protein [Vicinamibacterales bacterium]